MTTTTETKSCQACAYWKADSGECRRNAPQLIAFEIDDETKVESRFPTTAATDWCGDFQAK